MIRSPNNALATIDQAIDDLVGQGGVISDRDRQELLTEMERRLGVSKSQAEEMLDRWQADARAAYEKAQKQLNQARVVEKISIRSDCRLEFSSIASSVAAKTTPMPNSATCSIRRPTMAAT